eukprot:3582733-Amphidinium_carterae.1
MQERRRKEREATTPGVGSTLLPLGGRETRAEPEAAGSRQQKEGGLTGGGVLASPVVEQREDVPMEQDTLGFEPRAFRMR